MARTFAAERADDEARLAGVTVAHDEGGAGGAADEPTRVEADATSASVSGDVVPPVGRADAKRRLSRLALPLAIVTLLGAATTLFTRSRAASLGDDRESARGAITPPASSMAEAPAAASAEVVVVDVDPTLRAVLVDGARRDERPLRLMLPRARARSSRSSAPTGASKSSASRATTRAARSRSRRAPPPRRRRIRRGA